MEENPVKSGLRIIDSDMHIMQLLGLWDRYMEVRFRILRYSRCAYQRAAI